MKFGFWWPAWLLPKKLRLDLERRSTLTGRARVGKEYLMGGLSWSVTAARPDDAETAAGKGAEE